MAELQTRGIQDRPSAALNSMGVRTFPHVWLLICRWISSSSCLEQMTLPVFNRTPLRIAIGAAHLIDLVNTLNGGVGTTYKNPKVLLICPPPLNLSIESGPIFGPMFQGGFEKSKQLPDLYEAVAKMGGAGFLNAGSVISTDGVDGLHLTAESERKLGTAIAAKVKEMLK